MFSYEKPIAFPASGDLTVKNRPVLSGAENVLSICFAMSRSGIFLVLIVTMGLLALPVTAFTTRSIVTAGNVYVSNITFDPEFFLPMMRVLYAICTNGNLTRVSCKSCNHGDKNIRLKHTLH